MSAHNPFRAKAEKAAGFAARYNRPAAHDAAMASSFPLGAGYGQRGAGKRIEATITRAGKAVYWVKEAARLAALADAFDAGKVDAQGRRSSPASVARSEKRAAYADSRAARIEAAKAIRDSRPREEVSPEDWATASGYLGGSGRALVMSGQAEYIALAAQRTALAQEEPRP